jgi:hypothetical protein
MWTKEGRTDGHTDKRDEANSSFFFLNFANMRKYLEWFPCILYYCVDKGYVVSDGKCHFIKMYLGVKVEFHAFLTLRQPVIVTTQ